MSLQPWELEDENFVPPEKWPLFFELRLRPMVYILHRAVTHDFTLVGRVGRYSILELDELRWWLMQILWRCHLVVRNMHTTALPYSDEDAPPFPPPIEIPGESTAMFEIILKICLSLGFPEKIDPNADLIQGALAPLVATARKTKFRRLFGSFEGPDTESFLLTGGVQPVGWTDAICAGDPVGMNVNQTPYPPVQPTSRPRQTAFATTGTSCGHVPSWNLLRKSPTALGYRSGLPPTSHLRLIASLSPTVVGIVETHGSS
ncbi:hypothetical protein C8J57DRAFT_1212289 [Mycena rebaudengoi]|nr:hypothetical protein C8J57DRAFT_1212289 [Mycena rebaudengoi]